MSSSRSHSKASRSKRNESMEVPEVPEVQEDRPPLSAEEHQTLEQLLQAIVAVLKRRPADEPRRTHRAEVLEEMITQGNYPVPTGMTFADIIFLAEGRNLIELVRDDEYIEFTW